jgi:hypothetical protein
MTDQHEDLAERLGRTVNELDIDFSSFSIAGWLVSATSLLLGGGIAWGVYQSMPKLKGPNDGPALVLGLTMIGVTVASFLALRWLSNRIGFPITRSKVRETEESRERIGSSSDQNFNS